MIWRFKVKCLSGGESLFRWERWKFFAVRPIYMGVGGRFLGFLNTPLPVVLRRGYRVLWGVVFCRIAEEGKALEQTLLGQYDGLL